MFINFLITYLGTHLHIDHKTYTVETSRQTGWKEPYIRR